MQGALTVMVRGCQHSCPAPFSNLVFRANHWHYIDEHTVDITASRIGTKAG